ncbi:hypothetical protein H6P81_009894 [Aristolochia fimbriata]|uniref:Dof zinc finger protein n=1 Tax=Aristolochia fimbriata TaxID=158543 RepID=A0AAV7EMQ9_ARIFI|nr:hypothetical protein H6P81_009894 [Aristolochia fimbriata]
MGLTSLQVCMDTSDWLQGTVHEEGGPDSASPPGEMLTCARGAPAAAPLLERRLRPPHDQALKCPRCDSTHTKFCYYNNYSLSQPRYFCKTCRRYWTKGGSLRNVPVGGGCRKNKKSSSSSSAAALPHSHMKKQLPHEQSLLLQGQTCTPPNLHLLGSSSSSSHDATDLHLSYSYLHALPNSVDQCKYETDLLGNNNYHLFNDHHKFDALFGNATRYAFMGGNVDMSSNGFGFGSPGFAFDASSQGGGFMESSSATSGGSERTLMLPFCGAEAAATPMDTKPNPKQLLSLEWHEQPHCSEVGFLMNAPGSSWPGLMMNGYGSTTTVTTTTTNPLV